MAKGIVYVIQAPGDKHVKVGRTSRTIEKRLKEINGAGVLNEYELQFKLQVKKPVEVEKLAHQRLAQYRIRDDKEMFRCSVRKARKAVRKAAVESSQWKWIPGKLRRLTSAVRSVFKLSVGAAVTIAAVAVVDVMYFQVYFDRLGADVESADLSLMFRQLAESVGM